MSYHWLWRNDLKVHPVATKLRNILFLVWSNLLMELSMGTFSRWSVTSKFSSIFCGYRYGIWWDHPFDFTAEEFREFLVHQNNYFFFRYLLWIQIRQKLHRRKNVVPNNQKIILFVAFVADFLSWISRRKFPCSAYYLVYISTGWWKLIPWFNVLPFSFLVATVAHNLHLIWDILFILLEF